MLRTAFRITCVLLLTTIIIDVTNSKCFNKSLTYKYSKQLGSGQVKDAILRAFKELKKTLRSFTGLPKKGFPKCLEDACAHWKHFADRVVQWTMIIYKDPKLLMELVKNFTCKNLTKKQAGINSSPINGKATSITGG